MFSWEYNHAYKCQLRNYKILLKSIKLDYQRSKFLSHNQHHKLHQKLYSKLITRFRQRLRRGQKHSLGHEFEVEHGLRLLKNINFGLDIDSNKVIVLDTDMRSDMVILGKPWAWTRTRTNIEDPCPLISVPLHTTRPIPILYPAYQ